MSNKYLLSFLENQMQLAIRNQIALQNGELKHLHQGILSNTPINRIKILSVQLQKNTENFKQSITKYFKFFKTFILEMLISLQSLIYAMFLKI